MNNEVLPSDSRNLVACFLSKAPIIVQLNNSQTSNPPTLERQAQHKQAGNQKQSTRSIDRCARFQIRKHGDDRRHNPKYSIGGCRQRISSSSVFRGEYFRRVSVQHRVHDVGNEVVSTLPS